MDQNQFLLNTMIGFPTTLVFENHDQNGRIFNQTLPMDDGSPSTMSSAMQTPVSNQNMVELGKKLLQAASENDVENVRLLMTGGAPFTGNWLGTTPLHAAAKAGHKETVELLLKAGIFRDAKTKVERTALQMAAEEGHTAIVQMLLDHNADINAKDMLRMTALHWAVERCHIDTVSLLLAAGADVMAVNKFDKTSLDIACENSYEDIILQLIKAKSEGQPQIPIFKTEPIFVNERNEKLCSNESEVLREGNASWKNSPEEDALNELTAGPSEPNSREAVKLLESHGISFLPVDNSTLLTSALESGQSISLTEAGKMALNQTKKTTNVLPGSVQSSSPAKKFKLSSSTCNSAAVAPRKILNHPRVVTITAEQFLALASRLQQQQQAKGIINQQPMIISLPKTMTVTSKTANSVAEVTGNKVTPKVTTLSEFLSSQSVANSPSKSAFDPIKPAQSSSPTSGPCLKENPAKFDSFPNAHDPITSSSPTDSGPAASSAALASVTEVIEEPMQNEDTFTVVEVNTENDEESTRLIDERKTHFFKSGQLKGSARTTPMTILCRMKKRLDKEKDPLEFYPETVKIHQPNLNNAALLLPETDDDMLMTHEPGSEGSSDLNGTSSEFPVWLSIMEEDNSQFSAGATENDDDLLDPTRLAAQLASIRQAASQYSFSS